MFFMKKHVGTVIVLGGILISVLWPNSKFNSVEYEMTQVKVDMTQVKVEMNIIKDSISDINREMRNIKEKLIN